jgi:hypothetical protein
MTDQKDKWQRRLAAEGVPLGVYVHEKGGDYLLFAVSCDERNGDFLAHYYSFEKRTRWTRTLVNFMSRFQYKRPATLTNYTMLRDELAVALGITSLSKKVLTNPIDVPCDGDGGPGIIGTGK